MTRLDGHADQLISRKCNIFLSINFAAGRARLKAAAIEVTFTPLTWHNAGLFVGDLFA